MTDKVLVRITVDECHDTHNWNPRVVTARKVAIASGCRSGVWRQDDDTDVYVELDNGMCAWFSRDEVRKVDKLRDAKLEELRQRADDNEADLRAVVRELIEFVGAI